MNEEEDEQLYTPQVYSDPEAVYPPPAPTNFIERGRLAEPDSDYIEVRTRPLRVVVLTGLKEELEGLLKTGFEWDDATRLYRSLQRPGLYAGTLGPGLKKRKEIRRALERIEPDVIINGGLVGSLKDPQDSGAGHATGDRLRLGEVVDVASGTIYPGGRGRDRLATVDRPIFEPLAKMNLRLDTGAVACDMEGSRLLRLLGQMEDRLPEVHVILCKVVGDLPEDYFLFQLEDQIRSWSQRTRWEKLRVFLRYPGNALRLNRLFRVKRRALDSLTGRMGALVRRLYREGRVAQDMDSVFIPH